MKIEEIYELEPRLRKAVFKFANTVPLSVEAIRVLEAMIEAGSLVGKKQTLKEGLDREHKQSISK